MLFFLFLLTDVCTETLQVAGLGVQGGAALTCLMCRASWARHCLSLPVEHVSISLTSLPLGMLPVKCQLFELLCGSRCLPDDEELITSHFGVATEFCLESPGLSQASQ